MSSLVSLEISCQASGGFEGWQRLPLKRLVIRGPDWEQEDFDAIGNIATLQFLQLDTTKITRENLGSLSKLKHLKTMCLVSSRKKEGIAGLDQLQSMPNLKSLTLIGDVAANEIDALSTNNNLDSISFYGGSPNDRIVRNISSGSLTTLEAMVQRIHPNLSGTIDDCPTGQWSGTIFRHSIAWRLCSR